MKTSLLLGAFAVAASAAGAVPSRAQTPPARPRACLDRRYVLDTRPAGPRGVIIHMRDGSAYRVEASNDCMAGAVSSDPVGLSYHVAGYDVCKPIDLSVTGRGGRCIVTSIRPMTPAEIAALPPWQKP